jgi:hypothetical protein
VPGADGVYAQALLTQLAPFWQSGVAATQSLQVPPPVPQALALAPLVQTPPLQQPLQAPALQLPPAMHCDVAALHTLPLGQSPAPVQPHLPLTQALPAALPVQGPQLAPPVPQERLPCEP